jgi:hypothetical protein
MLPILEKQPLVGLQRDEYFDSLDAPKFTPSTRGSAFIHLKKK